MKHILYDSPANKTKTQEFQCLGYDCPAVGTVYPRCASEWDGVPLGGLGAGYITMDTDGRIGRGTIFNDFTYSRKFEHIPFSVKVDGEDYALAIPKNGSGSLCDLTYFGHFPISDIRYKISRPLDIEIRSYGVFIPGRAEECNIPAVIFQVYLTNSSEREMDIALSFHTPPSPTGIVKMDKFTHEGWDIGTITYPWAASVPAFGIESFKFEMSCAGEGAVYSAGTNNMTAESTFKLCAGERVSRKFILVWYHPYVRDNWNNVWKMRYTKRFSSSLEVLNYALRSHEGWLSSIIKWQSEIYKRDTWPMELREALLNSFYSICKNSIWLTRDRTDDPFGEQGLMIVNESMTTCSISETLPCHYLGQFPMLFFFPELELATIDAYARFQLSDGEIPFCFGTGLNVNTPVYRIQHTNGNAEFIEIVARYWMRTGDVAFLQKYYPIAKKAMEYVRFLDDDGDGLTNEHPHVLRGELYPANLPWDMWPQYGTSSYTAIKSLTAQIVMSALAQAVKDTQMSQDCQNVLSRGREALENLLWNGSYYILSADPVNGERDTGCNMAQVYGILASRILGLSSPVPQEHTDLILQSIKKLNSGLSKYGYVLAATENGEAVFNNANINNDFPRDVWPVFNFALSALMVYEQSPDALNPMLTVLDTLYHEANAMPWGWPCNLNGFTGNNGHGHDYQDPLTIWTIPLALEGKIISELDGGGLVSDMLKAGSEK